MSDSGAARLIAAALIGTVTMVGAQPIDVFGGLGDPLRVAPPQLAAGVVLPGDTVSVACPSGFDGSRPLTLAEAVDLALCNNRQIKLAWVAIKAKAAALGVARSAYLPALQGTVSELQSRTAYPGSALPATSNTGSTVFLGLTWRLFDFGGRSAATASAEQALAAALASHDASLQAALGSVVQAFFDAVTSIAVVEARAQAADVAQATADSAQRRAASGAAGRSDELQAAAALAKAVLARTRAEGDARKAHAMLVYALGLPASTPVAVASLPDRSAASAPEDDKSLAAWLDETSQRHPAILAARADLEAARLGVASARAEGLPTVDLTLNRYQNGYPGQGLLANNTRINTIGVLLTVPLFDGFARHYKIEGARAQVEQSEWQLRDVEGQLLREVVKAYSDTVSSAANLDQSQRLVEASQAAQAAARRRYDKGAADILEILTAQGALADAALERVTCLSEWRSARLRLAASAGGLGHGTLAE